MSEKEQHNDFEALCAGYVLDAVTEEERKRFEKMLESADADQQALFQEMSEARDELALAIDAPEPSDELFVDVLNRISDKPAQEARVLPIWAYKAAAALFLVGFLALALFTQQLSGTLEEREAIISDQMSTIIDNMDTITRLESEVEQKGELLAILESREINFVVMAGQEVNPDGYGKVIWDTENQRALLQLANLPAPPEDKDYQLWLIKDDQDPISAGVFNFDQPSTDLFFRVEQIQERPSELQNIFAVTLEPKGGMPQPTGDMFLAGSEN